MVDSGEVSSFLHGLPAFERFNERQMGALISQIDLEVLAPGTEIIKRGEQGRALFIVMKGVIRITDLVGPAQEGSDFAEARVGEIVGRLSLVPDMPSPVTCFAAGEATVIGLSLEKYRALFLLAPAVAHQFQYMTAARLAQYLQMKNKALRQQLMPSSPPSLLERLFGVVKN